MFNLRGVNQMKLLFISVLLIGVASIPGVGQNTNSSTPTSRPRSTANTDQSTVQQPTEKKAATRNVTQEKSTTPQQVPGSAAVVDAFNKLLEAIRKADVNAVMSIYWNSPRLILFNNNGTVTKGWDQVKKNRESSYPDLKDVKLEVRDVSVIMIGRDGAVVSCLWTQSQTYKGTPETASGRMTLVFRRVGTGWKAIHLHTSPDKPDASRVMPSEQPSPSPNP
jgi:ketosteroid isomerase-like protein